MLLRNVDSEGAKMMEAFNCLEGELNTLLMAKCGILLTNINIGVDLSRIKCAISD